MSFAEIKKAVNSDLNVPLNELLKKYLEIGSKVVAGHINCGTLTTTSVTPLEVSGAGMIHELYISQQGMPSNVKMKVKITVDDNVIFNEQCGSTAVNNTCVQGIKNSKSTIYNSYELLYNSSERFPRYVFLTGQSSELVTKTISDTTGIALIIKKDGIRFEKSFKIEVSATGTSNNYSAQCTYNYTLDNKEV